MHAAWPPAMAGGHMPLPPSAMRRPLPSFTRASSSQQPCLSRARRSAAHAQGGRRRATLDTLLVVCEVVTIITDPFYSHNEQEQIVTAVVILLSPVILCAIYHICIHVTYHIYIIGRAYRKCTGCRLWCRDPEIRSWSRGLSRE